MSTSRAPDGRLRAANDGGVTAYDPSEWSELFVATAGASAALAGLVFVAVSINIERIIG